MYILKTEQSFDAAHFLSGYQGKCSNIHGHRWTIHLEVMTEELCSDRQLNGMYVDFGQLKKDLKEEADWLDHCMIIEKGSLKDKTMEALQEENFRIVEMDFRPTAENLSKYFYEQMQKRNYRVRRVTIYETPTNCASYMEEPVQ